MHEMRELVESYAIMKGQATIPALMEQFLLRNGKDFDSGRNVPKMGKVGMCFSNALHYAREHGIKYVEGFATRKNLGLPIHHAWCSDGSNVAIDPTWRNLKNDAAIFLGVEFDAEEASKRMVENGYYGLLAPLEMYDIKFMIQVDPGMKELVEAAKSLRVNHI